VIVDQLQQMWTGLIDFTSKLVIPDWGSLVALLPVFLVVGVVGPILTLLAIGWLVYGVRKPRLATTYRELRRPAPLDDAGAPIFPLGEPYSPAEGMIYEPGATRAESGTELVVACPKCRLVRPAVQDRCGNCGLAFTLQPASIVVRPAGPPPGGAAAA
jgi:hypothetical protein